MPVRAGVAAIDAAPATTRSAQQDPKTKVERCADGTDWLRAQLAHWCASPSLAVPHQCSAHWIAEPPRQPPKQARNAHHAGRGHDGCRINARAQAKPRAERSGCGRPNQGCDEALVPAIGQRHLHRRGSAHAASRFRARQTRRRTRVPLVPPKPKLFLTARSMRISRAVLAQ